MAPMDEPMDKKYVVFKRSDWEDWVDKEMRETVFAYMIPPPVDDAVVIRRQDVFAPPQFDGYANGITVATEAMRKDKGGYDTTLIARLQRIADYFHEQARLSWDTDRKLPD